MAAAFTCCACYFISYCCNPPQVTCTFPCYPITSPCSVFLRLPKNKVIVKFKFGHKVYAVSDTCHSLKIIVFDNDTLKSRWILFGIKSDNPLNVILVRVFVRAIFLNLQGKYLWITAWFESFKTCKTILFCFDIGLISLLCLFMI